MQLISPTRGPGDKAAAEPPATIISLAVNESRVKRYTAIESMPTWPVDVKIRRRFGLRNALLVAPALAQFLGAAQATQNLIENLQKFLSRLT